MLTRHDNPTHQSRIVIDVNVTSFPEMINSTYTTIKKEINLTFNDDDFINNECQHYRAIARFRDGIPKEAVPIRFHQESSTDFFSQFATISTYVEKTRTRTYAILSDSEWFHFGRFTVLLLHSFPTQTKCTTTNLKQQS